MCAGAVGNDFAFVHVTLHCALTPPDDLLRHAVSAVDVADLCRKVRLVQHVVEGLGNLVDLRAQLVDGVVEILGAVDAKAEPRAGRLDGFDEKRKAKVRFANARQRRIVERVERSEPGDVLGHDLAHHLAAPVLVLALEQRFKRG